MYMFLTRCGLWCQLVGRITPAGVGRFSPRLAWTVATILTQEAP